jgi:lipoate-protein ligase A
MRLLIALDSQEPRCGLATDEALLESVRGSGQDTIRLWVNDRAAIVGRSQSVADEVDVRFAARCGIPILRRISGGGTVYHYPGNLNISVVLRDGRKLGSVGVAFQRFGETIAKALVDICPAISWNENDLLIDGKKVGGAAQARRGDSLLYHTTLLVGPADVRMPDLLLAMRDGYRPKRVASRPRRTVSLAEAIGADLSMAQVAEILAPALAGTLSEPLGSSDLERDEKRRLRWLAESKYGDPVWNQSR